MSEDERTAYKVITLKGSDNYEDWKLSILFVLLSKDILDFVKTTKATTEAKDKRDAGKCFALIIQSLSPVITSSLPANVRNPLDPKAALLWDHLEKTFSPKSAQGKQPWCTNSFAPPFPRARIQCRTSRSFSRPMPSLTPGARIFPTGCSHMP